MLRPRQTPPIRVVYQPIAPVFARRSGTDYNSKDAQRLFGTLTESNVAQMLSVDDWVKKLSSIAERDFTLERVLTFTQQYAVRPDTLSPYLFFSLGNYTRNLIFRNDLFEVLAICWEIGQASGIHNHRDQNCWMAAPIGRLRVQNYRVQDRNPDRKSTRLNSSHIQKSRMPSSA